MFKKITDKIDNSPQRTEICFLKDSNRNSKIKITEVTNAIDKFNSKIVTMKRECMNWNIVHRKQPYLITERKNDTKYMKALKHMRYNEKDSHVCNWNTSKRNRRE
jgi:hypothetical protein